MTIEELEQKAYDIFAKHLSDENKERIRWFIVKVQGERQQKRVSITSQVMDDRFKMHTMVLSVRDNYEDAFDDVIRMLGDKFEELK